LRRQNGLQARRRDQVPAYLRDAVRTRGAARVSPLPVTKDRRSNYQFFGRNDQARVPDTAHFNGYETQNSKH
jgi:hypothetical protein